jgi:hypothetical protein
MRQLQPHGFDVSFFLLLRNTAWAQRHQPREDPYPPDLCWFFLSYTSNGKMSSGLDDSLSLCTQRFVVEGVRKWMRRWCLSRSRGAERDLDEGERLEVKRRYRALRAWTSIQLRKEYLLKDQSVARRQERCRVSRKSAGVLAAWRTAAPNSQAQKASWSPSRPLIFPLGQLVG